MFDLEIAQMMASMNISAGIIINTTSSVVWWEDVHIMD
jgi:hypothetical protein